MIRTKVARRQARLESIKDCLGAEDYTHGLRQIEQGRLEPDPMTTCWICSCEQPILAFQPVGWLVPPTAVKTAPAAETPAQPTRAELEHRVADLEAEVARLRGGSRQR